MTADGAATFVPHNEDLDQLAEAARTCKGCGLYLDAEQTVFGEGSREAPMMLVGEQPGDQEDGEVGPLSGLRGVCSTRRWWRPASTATGSMSPTPSSISNSPA